MFADRVLAVIACHSREISFARVRGGLAVVCWTAK